MDPGDNIQATVFERQGSAPPRDGRPGIISFFSNPAAVAADIGAAISIIGFVVTMILTQKNIITSNYAAFVFLFLTVLGLQLHAAFNGRVIRTITNNDLGGQNSDEN